MNVKQNVSFTVVKLVTSPIYSNLLNNFLDVQFEYLGE
jgi:hypothetical protein